MSRRTGRIAALVLMLMQIGVAGFYAPVHRLMHHTLCLTRDSHQERVETAQPQAALASCHSRCCHHRPASGDSSASGVHDARPINESVPSTPCPDEESDCPLCAVALQQVTPASPLVVQVVFDSVESAPQTACAVAASRPATAFDVRGPPLA